MGTAIGYDESPATGGTTLPRQSRAGVAWLTTRMPATIHDAIKGLADAEGRSLSNMALRLIEEALRERGINLTKQDIDVGDTDDNE